MSTIPQEPKLLYLLHFDPPYRRARHYLGITAADRLPKRLLEHLRGTGSTLTRRALAQGSILTLAWLCHGATRQDERRVKSNGHLSRLCPLCTHSLRTPEVLAYPPLVSRASAPGGPGFLSF